MEMASDRTAKLDLDEEFGDGDAKVLNLEFFRKKKFALSNDVQFYETGTQITDWMTGLLKPAEINALEISYRSTIGFNWKDESHFDGTQLKGGCAELAHHIRRETLRLGLDGPVVEHLEADDVALTVRSIESIFTCIFQSSVVTIVRNSPDFIVNANFDFRALASVNLKARTTFELEDMAVR